MMTQSEARPVTVNSIGSGALIINNISVVGPGAGDFAIESQTCSGSSIAPRGNCVINVRFIPRAAKFLEATLVITHNGPGGRSNVPLSGGGEAPALSLSTTELLFGEVSTPLNPHVLWHACETGRVSSYNSSI